MEFSIFEERIEELKKTLNYSEKLAQSLAMNTSNHRKFSSQIGIEFKELKEVYEAQELKILIDYYTICEQLIKEFIFSTLEIDRNSSGRNLHISKYIKSKFKRDTYSPKVLIDNITDNINEILELDGKKYSFLKYSLDSEIKNRHDALIRARHTYAHKGNKPNFDILQYIQGNVMFLEFLLKEIKLLKCHLFDRIELQERFENILNEYNKLCKANINVKTYQSSLSKLKKECIEFLKIYNSLDGLMNSYSDIYKCLSEISKIDLRRKKIYNQNKLLKIDFR